ncbi:hypothetical protein TNCV_2165861 [Trichonephila clavipes]|nr:hypothetical protein TNCV_2165861 [Trichonephila clavipes]
MVIRSEGEVEYVMVGVSRRPTQAIWRGEEIEPSPDNYPVSEVRVNEFPLKEEEYGRMKIWKRVDHQRCQKQI